MKKVLGILVAIVIMASSFAGFSVSATEVLSGGFVVDGTVLVWYEGPGGDIVVPDGITEIEGYAFYGSGATSIVIADSVTTITDRVFAGCSFLKSITFGAGIESIDFDTLFYAGEIEEINVSADNKQYSSLDGVLFDKEKTTLVRYPDAKSDSEYTIPDGIVTIGYRAFYSCEFITSVSMPDSVKTIGEDAFPFCYSLVSINIPNGVTSVGDNAFYQCYLLESINIPSGLTVINSGAFSVLTSVKTMTIPDGVTTIEDQAFIWCTSLKSISIPDSVETIEHHAFLGCELLAFVYIPDSVTYMGDASDPVTKFVPFDSATTLIVNEGSYAHEWAIENEHPYVLSSILSFDDVVDVYELLKLITYEVPLSAAQVTAADVSGDSKVNCVDALTILKYVMNK